MNMNTPTQELSTVKDAQLAPIRQTFDIQALFAAAIEKGVSVDTMERMLAMRTQIKAEQAKQDFIDALAAFQRSCPIISKNSIVKNKEDRGGGVRYRFASLEHIVKETRALIAEHGFSYRFDSTTDNDKICAKCIITHREGHSEVSSFEVRTDPNAGKIGMNELQKYASALSYAKRYAFCAAFGIQTGDEDDDANSTHTDNSARAKLARKLAKQEEYQQEVTHAGEEEGDAQRGPDVTHVQSTITPGIEKFLETVGAETSTAQMTALWRDACCMGEPEKTIAKRAVTNRCKELNLAWDATAKTFISK